MRIVNGILFVFLFMIFLFQVRAGKRKECSALAVFVKKHIYILGLLLIVNCISFGMTFVKEDGGIYIEREGYGGEEQQIALLLEKDRIEEQVTLNVSRRKYTKKEQDKKMQEAFAYLESHMKGENPSLSEVTTNLDFSIDYEEYPFDVEFQPEDYMLIDGDGNLKNEKADLLAEGYEEKSLCEGIHTKVTVTLWYGEESKKQDYAVTVFPKKEEKNSFASVVKKLQEAESRNVYQKTFLLPAEIDGIQITRMDESGITPFSVLVMGIIFAGLLLLKERETLRQTERQKKEILQRCYPWFVNELVLLLGAGMQTKNIFDILLREYGEEENLKPLMEELKMAKYSMEMGMPEEQVYYRMGRRLKLSCYIKLMTLLEQNVKRGAKGLTAIFEQEELAALEERKNLAKRYGEEAGTKLLGPMILLLLVIMFMIMIPAFLSFG